MTRDYENLLEGGLGAKIARAIQEIWDEESKDEASNRTYTSNNSKRRNKISEAEPEG